MKRDKNNKMSNMAFVVVLVLEEGIGTNYLRKTDYDSCESKAVGYANPPTISEIVAHAFVPRKVDGILCEIDKEPST